MTTKHCPSHEDTRDMVSNLSGQMRMLMMVLGGCWVLLSGVLSYVLLHGNSLDMRVSSTISGVSKNRTAIRANSVFLSDHETRIRHVERIVE